MAVVAPAPPSIEEVLADSLAHWMVQKEFHTQNALAEKAGVDQKTVSNCLNPDQRLPSTKGRDNTPRLGTVDRLARALEIPLWMLLKPLPSNDPLFKGRPALKMVHRKQRKA